MIPMKILPWLVLLLSLISSCIAYEGMKVERTEAELNKKETNLQGEIDRVQGDVDRLEREIEAQKKKIVSEGE
jgi:peptidoglycan hydrolase CwlO-like protein